MSAIFQNRDSIFDTPSWMALPPPQYVSLNSSISLPDARYFHEFNKLCMIKLPRLVRLVRESRITPEDTKARTEAFELAQLLYSYEIEPYIQAFMATGIIKPIPSSFPALENCFDFSSFIIHAFCGTYWNIRVLVGGLIIALSQIPTVDSYSIPFDMPAVIASDVRMAQYIAMSVDFSLKTSAPLAVHTIRQLMPIQTSFGAWHRLELREGGASSMSTDAMYARKMKKWCSNTIVQFATHFGAPLRNASEE